MVILHGDQCCLTFAHIPAGGRINSQLTPNLLVSSFEQLNFNHYEGDRPVVVNW